LFQRLDGATTSVEAENTAEALRSGVADLSNQVVNQIGKELPEDEYIVSLADTYLALVRPGEPDDFYVKEQTALFGTDSFWGLPHDPRVPYYRAGHRRISEKAALFQFVVPMFPENWLTADLIADYTNQLAEQRHPTAVSLALLDVKGPADWSDIDDPIHEHWTLTHFLIDGHHKAAAARRSGGPLRLLSFIAVKQGVSERAQLEVALAALTDFA